MIGIILASWDHIVGPQIEKLWMANVSAGNRLSEVSEDIIRDFNASKHFKDCNSSANATFEEMKIYCIMCGQLLLGEVDSDKSVTQWASRLYVSECKIICGVIFHQKLWLGFDRSSKKARDACLCIGAIFKRDALSFVLNNQALIDFHLRKCIDKMQHLKILKDSYSEDINCIIEDVTTLLTSLEKSNKSSFENKNQPLIEDFINSDILSKAIVSHLQTCGCTVVIGGSEFTINKVINVLSLLNIQKEFFYPLTSVNNDLKSFIQGIYVQGTIKNSNKHTEQILEEATRVSQSLTVVDIDAGKVWQTKSVQEVNGSYRTSSAIVVDSGALVPQLLNDLVFIQENDGDVRPFVQNFCNFLKAKSTALIEAIQQTRSAGLSLTSDELLMMYGVNNIADLKILFGCAEKLKPGFGFLF